MQLVRAQALTYYTLSLLKAYYYALIKVSGTWLQAASTSLKIEVRVSFTLPAATMTGLGEAVAACC